MGNESTAEALPYLNAEASSVTFSGFSAGCFMSHQMSIIYPDEVAGVGLFCCWPYGTKKSLNAETGGQDQETNAKSLIDANYAAGKIGDPSAISNQAVYIWTGLDDTTTPRDS